MMKIIDLGWCVAKLDEETDRLAIISASDGFTGLGCSPAESLIAGARALKALRDALNEAYPINRAGT